ELTAKGAVHAWLADWSSIARVFRDGKTPSMVRELEIDGRWFEQAIYPVALTGRLRIYGRDITERRQAEDALREREERLRQQAQLLEHAPVRARDLDDRVIVWTSGMERLYGYSRAEALGQKSHELLRTVFPKSREEARAALLRDGHWEGELGQVRRDGCEIIVNSRQVLHVDAHGRPAAAIVVDDDITALKKNEAELHRLNRTLRALSNSNQSMMRAVDESEYLHQVCKIIVEDCGHAMVWIGYAEEDEAKTVRPVAYAGFEVGYLETLKITWADTERGRGPTGTAVRTGKPAMCRHMLTDPKFVPWRSEALKRGYASSVVLPLISGAKVFGAITIYSREPDPFSEDEVRLLSELADDLAFGIVAIRIRQAHAKAEEALSLSEARYRSLFNAMTEGFALHEIICDESGAPCDYRFLEMNSAFEKQTGLLRDQVIGRTGHQVLPNDDPFWIEAYGKVALTGEPVRFESYSASLNRHYAVFAYSPAPRQFAVVFMDITDRRRMEEALRASKEELETVVAARTAELRSANAQLRLLAQSIVTAQEEERRRVSRELHDEAGQALTALKLGLQMTLDELPPDEPPPAGDGHRRRLEEAVTLTDRTIEEVRRLAHDLRPPALEAAGLDATLEGLCGEFARRTQIRISYVGVKAPPMTGPAAIPLYRILQEALTNAVRHGHASEMRVRLERDAEHVRLSIEDNGLGFDPAAALGTPADPKRMGLIGMQERLKMVGGWLEVNSKPGQGSQLIAHVPVEEA
ncbi:MAG: PAS domain S-box protein, partial [Chloroflexi bacterium]|nr:PAS domain S-box protein [Chloroflexota bacterium]